MVKSPTRVDADRFAALVRRTEAVITYAEPQRMSPRKPPPAAPKPRVPTMSIAACDQASPTALEPDSDECEYIIVEFNAATRSAADILATVESMTVQVCLKRASRGNPQDIN